MRCASGAHILRLEGRVRYLLGMIEAREKLNEPVSYERAECAALLNVLRELRALRAVAERDSLSRQAAALEWPEKSELTLLLLEAMTKYKLLSINDLEPAEKTS